MLHFISISVTFILLWALVFWIQFLELLCCGFCIIIICKCLLFHLLYIFSNVISLKILKSYLLSHNGLFKPAFTYYQDPFKLFCQNFAFEKCLSFLNQLLEHVFILFEFSLYIQNFQFSLNFQNGFHDHDLVHTHNWNQHFTKQYLFCQSIPNQGTETRNMNREV